MKYTIGQVAEMTGLPISTLRYYDREGLFPNMERCSGIRKFGEQEIEAIRVIECLKKSGLEIKQIKRFMAWCAQGAQTYSMRKALFEERRAIVQAEIERMNRVLVPRGLCLLPMRMDDGRALLYLYRPQALCRDLGDDLACRLLRQAGYPCGSCGRCVARLVQRLRTEEDFPHEVGLFLSYPPEDVQGFIDHRAMDFKCAGLWKVYGDQQRAQALFDRFRRCTQRYCALWQTGLRLEQLAVAV